MTNNIEIVHEEHFATCLGPTTRLYGKRQQCEAHFSYSNYPNWSDLKKAYLAHARTTGHIIQVGRFYGLISGKNDSTI